MATRRDKAMLDYRPGRKTYREKSDAEVIGTVKDAAKGMNLSQIHAIAQDAKQAAQLQTDSVDYMLRLVQGKHDLGIPDDKRFVKFDAKSAKPADIIFRVMGMLSCPMKFQFIAPNGKSMDKDKIDAIEAHLNALYPFLFRKYGVRFDTQALWWQLVGGTGWIQQTYLPNYWDKNYMKQGDGEADSGYNDRMAGYRGYMGPPIHVQSFDPRVIKPIETQMGVEAHVKAYRVQRWEMDAALAKAGKRVTRDRRGKVTDVETRKAGQIFPETAVNAETNVEPSEYFEYIDDVMCYYVADDRIVHKYAHNGGIGLFPAYGLQTGTVESAMKAVGILYPVRNEIPQLDFARTMWLQAAYLTVVPQLWVQLAEGDDPIRDPASGSPVQWDIEPGTVKQIRGQLVNALKEFGSGIDFRAFIEMLAGDIDLATLTPLARGIAGAQQPGYSINQLSQAMRLLWKPIIDSLQLQRSMMAEHYLRMVKGPIGAECSIFGETDMNEEGRRGGEYFSLGPDDIPEFFRVEAIVNPELPIDTQGNMVTWAKLHQEGMATWEEYTREGMGKTNPVARKRQVMRDLAERAFLPSAWEDAQALGRVRLTTEMLEAQGLANLNSAFSQDVQLLKSARTQQGGAGGTGGGGALQPPAGPPGDPNGAGPAIAPSTAGIGQGGGPPATAGANPADAKPGPRIGDAS